MNQVDVSSFDDLQQFVKQFTKAISPPQVVALYGNLGSGKTTFTQEFARSLGMKQTVGSPTYSIANIYNEGGHQINHLDLYRLESLEDAYNIGIEDFLYPIEFTIIEWPEIIEDILPDNTIKLYFSLSEDKRIIMYE